MKKLLIVAILVPLFLISCGKSEEVTTAVNTPVAEKQVVTTGGVVESNSGKVEETSTGMILENRIESNTWISVIDNSKKFDLDAYLSKWTYSIVQKFEENWYTVLIVDPNTNTGKIDNIESWATCVGQNISTCRVFIIHNNKLLYTNIEKETSNLQEDVWWIYGIWKDGVIFYNISSWWGMWTTIKTYQLTYINFKTLKKIYEVYTIKMIRDLDKNDNEIATSERIEYIKNFYNSAWIYDPNKKLNIKATNIEDAYFEYYKESR